MKIKNVFLLLLFVIMVFPVKGLGQTFPVQVTPQLIPPYNIRLSDYSTATSDRIVLNILLKDIMDNNRAITLKFSLATKDGIVKNTAAISNTKPITIDGGIPLRLSNLDLRPYFELQNLVGISPQKYNATLPDGMYQFCFEVFDAITGLPISNKGCATVFLTLSDPPILNMPFNNSEVQQKDPQNIIFQWTPRNLNASNVQYEFTLVEIWDEFINPQAVFLNSIPLYKTTTKQTSLIYGPGETALLPNKKYAWRVKADITDGISANSIFKNDGYSEIFSFTNVGICQSPKFVLGIPNGKTSAKITWQGLNHTKYSIEYRKKNAENPHWFPINDIAEETAVLSNLEENTTYEVKVGGQCRPNGGYIYSSISEFTTSSKKNEETNYTCGMIPDVSISNTNLLKSLQIDDTFTVGDFKVTVKEISGNEGIYTGAGYVKVPYLKTKLKVTFNGVKINTDKQLFDGVVITNFDLNDGLIYNLQDGIDKIKELSGSVLDKLDAIIAKIKEVTVGSDDLDKIIKAIENDIPAKAIEELKSINEKIKVKEAELKAATSEGVKKEIQHQINDLKEDFSKKIDTLKTEISGLIVKAIKDYYAKQKPKEANLVNQFNATIPQEQNTNKPHLPYQLLESEGEFEIDLKILPKNITQAFEAQEQYHNYFSLKAIAENTGSSTILKTFIEKALDSNIDLEKTLNDALNDNKTDPQIIEILSEKIKDAIQNSIDKTKYNYLN